MAVAGIVHVAAVKSTAAMTNADGGDAAAVAVGDDACVLVEPAAEAGGIRVYAGWCCYYCSCSN